MAYINFINGLRGISIILVLFYHLFDTNIFRNGFLGVDFFFVISGFILTYKYHSQKFNLKTFFYNRFRRIIPSLVLCIIFVHLLLFLLVNDNFILKENYKLIPNKGVYLIKAKIKNRSYYGMMNIGNRPTLNGKNETLEVNIFNFNENSYEKSLSIFF